MIKTEIDLNHAICQYEVFTKAIKTRKEEIVDFERMLIQVKKDIQEYRRSAEIRGIL